MLRLVAPGCAAPRAGRLAASTTKLRRFFDIGHGRALWGMTILRSILDSPRTALREPTPSHPTYTGRAARKVFVRAAPRSPKPHFCFAIQGKNSLANGFLLAEVLRL